MNKFNQKYWEDRYQNNETQWDLKEVSPPLKSIIDHLYVTYPANKEIKILVPGAGSGYEVAYLFNKGYKNIYAIDLAAKPLEKILKQCPDFPKSQLIQGDFFELNHNDFDLILEQTFFCALDPSLRTAYVTKMHQLLKTGGKLTGLLFQFPLTNEGPPFGGSIEEYFELFETQFQIKFIETAQNSIKPRADKELFFIFDNK